jgi:hypothetical protein
MESPEGFDTAENVADWLRRGRPGVPPGSAGVHYCIDRNSIVKMADFDDVTAGAGGIIPHAGGANRYCVHIELAGKAGQNAAQWADEASIATLKNCAELCREILVPSLQIPVRHLNIKQIQSLEKGFVGHVDITRATNKKNGHWDPGPHFPWDYFLSLVAPEKKIKVFFKGNQVKDCKAFQDDNGSTWFMIAPIAKLMGMKWEFPNKTSIELFNPNTTTPPTRYLLSFQNVKGSGYVKVSEFATKFGLDKVWDQKKQEVKIG